MKKFLKITFCLGVVTTLSALLCWIGLKLYLEKSAQTKAETILTTIEQQNPELSDDQLIIKTTKYVHQNFEKTDIGNVWQLKFRPYITNKRLPEFIRLKTGVIETLIPRGMCDNASRTLAFILEQRDFSSTQWNMVSLLNGGHSALVTTKNNNTVFADPFLGVVAQNKQSQLISPIEAQTRISQNNSIEKTIIKLDENSKTSYYEAMPEMFMAAEGESLEIKSKIPKPIEKITLGTIDGSNEDVKADKLIISTMPYGHYVGHKYNREWIRTYQAQSPIKIEIILTEQPEQGVLTSEPPATISGKKLTWTLNTNEKLTFHDGQAKINWQRLNSFIPVDQIIITPL